MTHKVSMAKRNEWWGQWWLPDKPGQRFGGMAAFDPDHGITLRLGGGFDHRMFDEPARGVKTYSGVTRQFPIVHGEAQGKVVTLLDCSVSSSSGPLFGDEPSDQILTARMLLQGCHLPDGESRRFVAVESVIENLPHYSPTAAIDGCATFPSKGSDRSPSATYQIGAVESTAATVGGNRYVLNYTVSFPQLTASRMRHEVHLWDEPAITVEFAEVMSAEDAVASTLPLRDLITLAIGRPSGIVSQRLFLAPDPSRYPSGHPYATQRIPVACFTAQAVVARPHDDPVPLHEVLFTLQDLPFADVIPRWLQTYEKFRAASNLILGLRYSPEQYLESRVIAAVAAAESFHRALDPTPPIPVDDFRALRRTLLDAAPSEYRSDVRDRLSRNEPSLKTRLLGLADRLDPAIVERVLPDRETWAKRARDSRNQLAHEGSRGDTEILDLYAVAEVTASIVTLNLLQEVGVPTERVVAKLSENRDLIRTVRLAHQHLGADSKETKR